MRTVVPAVVLVVLLVASAIAAAQAPGQILKPGPEVQKLAYFLGTWKYEGETRASDFGPAGKFSGEETCDWYTGGFQLVCQFNETSAVGKATGMNILAYDTEEKLYTYYSISSRGENLLGKGTITGTTLTTSWEGKVGGKPSKVRGTIVQVSPASYRFKIEGSVGGGPWVVVGEGQETKVK